MQEARIWHPYSQAQTDNVLKVTSAKASTITLETGEVLIDAISSWWVNPHGHSHPHINQKIYEQTQQLEHVIFAGFTHDAAEELCNRLHKHVPKGLNNFFFSDNGSTAVEAALKMSIQYFYNKGEKKSKIIAFENAYHGDTFGAMSSSQPDTFFNAFSGMLFDIVRVPVPTEENKLEVMTQVKEALLTNEVACFIYEPLLQAASGMILYPPHLLDMLIDLVRQHGALCIADEVMTGFGRTGKWFASDYLSNTPDIMCVSKCLTGGYLPMSLTIATDKLYDGFLSDDRSKMFFHGHSYTGNPVGCAAALASLDLFEKPEFLESLDRINKSHRAFADRIRGHKKVKNLRMFGTLIAFDFDTGEESSYFSDVRNKLYEFFISKGVLLRPLGNVVYTLPPYCITNEELEQIYSAVEQALEEI